MEERGHPRFLGFLWKHHKFERKKDLPCTFKCIYSGCDKEKHRPKKSDVEILKETEYDATRDDMMRVYVLVKCNICGRREHQLVGGLFANGYRFGDWE